MAGIKTYTPVCERLAAINSVFKRVINSEERPLESETDDEFADRFTAEFAADKLDNIASFLRIRDDFPSSTNPQMEELKREGSPELSELVNMFRGRRGVVEAPASGRGQLHEEYNELVKKIRCVRSKQWSMQDLRNALIGIWRDFLPNLSAACEYEMIIQFATAGNERTFRYTVHWSHAGKVSYGGGGRATEKGEDTLP